MTIQPVGGFVSAGAAASGRYVRGLSASEYEWAERTPADFNALPTFHASNFGIVSIENGGGDEAVPLIQDFLEAVRDAGGGIAYIPEGTYRAGGMTVYSNTWLMGAGLGRTVLKRKDNVFGNMMASEQDGHDIRITDLTIDGNRDNGWGLNGSGITFHWVRRGYVQRVEIRNVHSYGLGIGVSVDPPPLNHKPIQDCVFEDLWIHHIGLIDVNGIPQWNGDAFDGKQAANSTWRNIRIEDIHNVGLDLRIQECVIENVQARRCGLYAERSPGIDSANGKGIGITTIPGGIGDTPVPNPKLPRGFSFVSNCYALNCGGSGIHVVQANYETDDSGTWPTEIIGRTVIENCISFGNTKSGFKHGWQSGSDCNATVLYSNCVSECNGYFGYENNETGDPGPRFNYANCAAINNGMDGFKDRGGATATGSQHANCTAQANGGAGFHATAPYASYVGCRGEGNLSDALYIASTASDCDVTGFQALDLPAGVAGIHVAGDRAVITGGRAVEAAAATGLLIDASADKTRYDNVNHSNVTTSVTDGGTLTSAGTVIT